MSFAQGAPTQPLVLQGSNVFLYGSSTSGNAFTVQQLSAGNVASFVRSTGATAMMINPAGNVGIGVTNPGCALSFGATTNNKILCLWDGNTSDPVSTGYSFYGFGVNSNYLRFQVPGSGTTPSDGFYWYSANTERMRLQASTGNLGIGTNNPSKLLHVWGGMIIGASSDSRATTVTLNAPGATTTFSANSDIGDGARIMCLQCPDLSSTTANLVSFSLQVAPTGSFGTQRTSLDLKGFRVASQSYGGFCITSAFDTAGSYDLFYADRTKAYFQQNVGIGTNNPSSYTLQVTGSVGASTSFTRTTGSTGVAFAAPGTGLASTDYNLILTGANDTANRLVVFVNGSARTADNGISNVTIRNDAGSLFLGNSSYPTVILGSFVGIGTSTNFNSAFKQSIFGGDSSYTLYGPNATYSCYLAVGAGGTYAGAGRASVTCSNGNLHIDNATGGFQIYLNYFQGGGSGGVNASTGCYGAFFATGDITAFYSDERLKTKVGRIENALDKVCSLTAFKYVHNDIAKQNGFDGDDVQVGLSAQEVQKVLPEVVARAPFDMGTEYDVGLGKSKSGQDYLTLKYERLVPLLVEALKEEKAERLKVDESLRTTNERLARLEKLLLKE
jgi:hypothetical protein